MLTSSQMEITDLVLADRVKFGQTSNSMMNGNPAHPLCIQAFVWRRQAKGL